MFKMMSQLKHEQRSIREIVNDFRKGHLVVPEFERDYVWNPSKAPKLVDSLYRKFPISSLLLWDSNEHVLPRSHTRNTREFIGWLIDGQQRLTTLARTMDVDSDIDVVFNIESEDFARANAANRKDARWIKVCDAWDDDSFRRYTRNLDETPKDRRIVERLERLRSILDYEIPIVRMVGHSFEDAVAAFMRINTEGVRLKSADLESAHVAAKHSGFVRDKLIPFLGDLHNHGYDRITATHLFRTCAFIAHPDGRNVRPCMSWKHPKSNKLGRRRRGL